MEKKQLTKGIQEISHTADEAIEVSGFSIEDLFINAANGMLAIMGIIKKKRRMGKEKILLSGKDLESLLVTFLNEIVYYVEQKKFPNNFKIDISNFQLECIFDVVPVDSIRKEIKAVTYHHINIKHEKDQFSTQLVFDI